MSQARFVVGDVLEVLRSLPDDSVDLVLTSPPFLALRSYLPADHPQKDRELGSEPTPGAFIDALLDVVEECARVLAPHGSLCIELGDTFADSGGAGGDYGVDGLRAGQPTFDGSARRKGSVSPDGSTGHYTGRQLRPFGPKTGSGWPMPKSLALVPELFRIALAYGVNPLTGRTTEPWRIRNVVRWVRPNPPVGALGDKFRPATSEMVVATMSRTRYFDLDACREQPKPHTLRYPRNAEHYSNAGYDVPERGDGGRREATAGNPAGAPPLDWWAIPTEPYPGSHYATWPRDLLVRPIKAMCPKSVCPACGPIQSRNDAGPDPLRGMRDPYHESSGDEVLLSQLRVGGDQAQASGAHQGRRADEPSPATGVRGAALAGSPNGEQVRTGVPAPGDHGGAPGSAVGAERDRSSQERHQERQPPREPGSDGPGPALADGADGSQAEATTLPSLRGDVEFVRRCPRCGGPTRNGVVLDPFAGSGTTAQVATGHGRDCVLIDLDERNADLAMQRVGMFLTVEHFDREGAA